jgi:hypothetical protein
MKLAGIPPTPVISIIQASLPITTSYGIEGLFILLSNRINDYERRGMSVFT